jgi:hypothetical protein
MNGFYSLDQDVIRACGTILGAQQCHPVLLLLPLNKHRLTSSVAWQSLFVCWLNDSNLLRCTEANCLLLGQPPLHTDEATWNEQFSHPLHLGQVSLRPTGP